MTGAQGTEHFSTRPRRHHSPICVPNLVMIAAPRLSKLKPAIIWRHAAIHGTGSCCFAAHTQGHAIFLVSALFLASMSLTNFRSAGSGFISADSNSLTDNGSTTTTKQRKPEQPVPGSKRVVCQRSTELQHVQRRTNSHTLLQLLRPPACAWPTWAPFLSSDRSQGFGDAHPNTTFFPN